MAWSLSQRPVDLEMKHFPYCSSPCCVMHGLVRSVSLCAHLAHDSVVALARRPLQRWGARQSGGASAQAERSGRPMRPTDALSGRSDATDARPATIAGKWTWRAGGATCDKRSAKPQGQQGVMDLPDTNFRFPDTHSLESASGVRPYTFLRFSLHIFSGIALHISSVSRHISFGLGPPDSRSRHTIEAFPTHFPVSENLRFRPDTQSQRILGICSREAGFGAHAEATMRRVGAPLSRRAGVSAGNGPIAWRP